AEEVSPGCFWVESRFFRASFDRFPKSAGRDPILLGGAGFGNEDVVALLRGPAVPLPLFDVIPERLGRFKRYERHIIVESVSSKLGVFFDRDLQLHWNMD